MAVQFQVYKDSAGSGRWRLVSQNGNIIADSGEGYARGLSGAKRAVKAMQKACAALGSAEVQTITADVAISGARKVKATTLDSGQALATVARMLERVK